MIRTALKFGVFVVVCLMVTIYLAFTIGNIKINDPLNRDYYTLTATFDDVTGLSPDDNVKVAGVVVGKVTGVKVDHGRARVTFQVQNRYKVPSNSTAAIRWRNLIGQRYLYLNVPAKPASDTLRGGDSFDKACDTSVTERCTTSVVDLGELFNRLGPIVAAVDPRQVNDFLDTVSQALNGNEDKLSQSIDDLAVLAKALAQRDATIGRLVENLNTVAGTVADRDQQIRIMLDNLVLISQTFSDNTQTIDAALQEFARFSTNLSSVLDGNRGALDNIINNLDTLMTETIGPKLGTIDSALRELDVTAKSIFKSSDLGEWLNQSILCAAVGPPGPLGAITGIPANSNCLGLSDIQLLRNATTGASASTPAAAAPGAAPVTPNGSASIGTQAGTRDAGVTTLMNLLRGAAQ